ncbi:ABC-type nitrate/sulfonate/bicarbonate transport systems, periplasmic components [plant metagenome]|uniref:ABC-type nitrate/sulfonate/bicarbonate transport systems, periplasmic components n=1 Tax=plant metagenome TaxID=1297885 RepID=A0A484PD04_9ZZZZ
MTPRITRLAHRLAAAACLMGTALAAQAATLTVTHWGQGMYGVPFAVALEKGYFKEAGLDITGFMTSPGGGTTVRNAMASEIPYGEVALPAAIAAIQQGSPLTIIHGGVLGLADLQWAARPDSKIGTPADMAGATLGYSSPKSVTDMVSTLALTQAGVMDKTKRTAVGSVSAGMTALREKAVDAVYITEPILSQQKDRIRVAFRSDAVVPRMTQTVGIVRTDYLEKNADTVRAIVNARRKGVEFILANPEEAATILAKHYKLEPEVARAALATVMADKDYWSLGRLDYAGMAEMLKGLVLVKAVESGDFDWKRVSNEALLPDDQRSR